MTNQNLKWAKIIKNSLARGTNLKPEAKLYNDLKRKVTKISWNRLENRSLLGTPDLLAYAINEHFFTLELKVYKRYKITLFTPPNSLPRETQKEYLYPCCLHPGPWACALVPWSSDPGACDSGLKLEPLALGWDACRLKLESL